MERKVNTENIPPDKRVIEVYESPYPDALFFQNQWGYMAFKYSDWVNKEPGSIVPCVWYSYSVWYKPWTWKWVRQLTGR